MLYESPPVHKPFIPPAEVPSRILFSRINDVFPKFFRRRGIQSHPMLYCIFLIKASLRRRHLTFGKEMTLQFLTKRYIPSPEPNTKPELYTMKVLSSLASMKRRHADCQNREAQGHAVCDLQEQSQVQGPPGRYGRHAPFQKGRQVIPGPAQISRRPPPAGCRSFFC